ncbi:MAG: hypothetical protein ACREDR_22555 [Blastocatellia bacterium]
MSDDDIKHQMDFILKQQAIFSSEMIELKNRMDETSLSIARLSELVERLSEHAERQDQNAERQSETIDRVAAVVRHLAETTQVSYQHLTESAELNRQEMRQAMENLITGNEATRDLANRAAQLAINVSLRLTTHEQEAHEEPR